MFQGSVLAERQDVHFLQVVLKANAVYQAALARNWLFHFASQDPAYYDPSNSSTATGADGQPSGGPLLRAWIIKPFLVEIRQQQYIQS